MSIKITLPEISRAIAATPKNNGVYDERAIAQSIADYINSEIAREKQEHDEWEAGRKGFEVRFPETNVQPGRPDEVERMQAEAQIRHAELVEQKIRSNKELIAGIGAAVVGIGTTAITGGAGSPVGAAAFLGIATQLANALNSGSIPNR
jgi:hypothetical protein